MSIEQLLSSSVKTLSKANIRFALLWRSQLGKDLCLLWRKSDNGLCAH